MRNFEKCSWKCWYYHKHETCRIGALHSVIYYELSNHFQHTPRNVTDKYYLQNIMFTNVQKIVKRSRTILKEAKKWWKQSGKIKQHIHGTWILSFDKLYYDSKIEFPTVTKLWAYFLHFKIMLFLTFVCIVFAK